MSELKQIIKSTKKAKNQKLIVYLIIFVKYYWNNNPNCKANVFFISLDNIKGKNDLYKIPISKLFYINAKSQKQFIFTI